MYQSTRGMERVHASKAIIQGLAPDGGLYTPIFEKTKLFSEADVFGSYQDTARILFRFFLDDFSPQEIEELLRNSYSREAFPDKIIGIEPFSDIAFLTLYHGETFAFKDMALSMLSSLQSLSKRKQNEFRKTIILTATSGDTGSAVLSGFRKDPTTEVFVLYPLGKISPFQEKQMHYLSGNNRHVIAVEGNFDDCQSIVKSAIQSNQLKNTIISTANSINIARVIVQIVYYFQGYFELLKRGSIVYGDKINISVPSGNFGNILAAYYAYKCGLPVSHFICASNQNKVLTDFFNTGIYDRNRPFYQTSSPSMDILVSSNLERLLFEGFAYDFQKVKKAMSELSESGRYQVDSDFLKTFSMMKAQDVSESECLRTIKETFDERGFLIDPHTSVAVSAHQKLLGKGLDNTYTMVVSTASPYKFMGAIQKAFGFESSHQLKTDCFAIERMFHIPIDKRIYQMIQHKDDGLIWKKQEALPKLLKWMGEIDDQN